MKRRYYYIGVLTEDGCLRYITKADHASHTWSYDVKEKPLSMDKSVAQDTCKAMCMNFTPAILVQSSFELTSHPGVAASLDAEAAVRDCMLPFEEACGLSEIHNVFEEKF